MISTPHNWTDKETLKNHTNSLKKNVGHVQIAICVQNKYGKSFIFPKIK